MRKLEAIELINTTNNEVSDEQIMQWLDEEYERLAEQAILDEIYGHADEDIYEVIPSDELAMMQGKSSGICPDYIDRLMGIGYTEEEAYDYAKAV